MDNRLPTERPSFPWVGVATAVVGVVVALALLRIVLSVLFGFAKLALIVLIAAAVGAAIARSKANR